MFTIFAEINIFMSRPKRLRKMLNPPPFKGYRPFGYYGKSKEPITLNFEEFEAMRLCDYELHTQAEAAIFMDVSRPTFTRIYESYRRKVAKAFAEAKVIEIEGGQVYFDEEWFRCKKCNSNFNNPLKQTKKLSCPMCGSKTIENYKELITQND